MRKYTALEEERLKILTEYSIELTVLEPTKNGLEKSILDATGPVRLYLKENNLHDYNLQLQGPENKVQLQACLIYPDKVKSSIASLYRPNTKKGDPRIWFKGLSEFASPNDIVVIFSSAGKLHVINITKYDIKALVKGVKNNVLKEIIIDIKVRTNLVSNELLSLLEKIAQKGAVPALLKADTAIGRTLETLLGININSSKQPDYKGIELKSFRDKRGNRKTLFAQVPDWSISKFKSSGEILDNFGYPRGSDRKLNCTVSTLVRNSQGLQLFVDENISRLVENSDKLEIGDFVYWTLENLHRRLLEKHNETFWIAADTSFINGTEYFQFKKVEHTKKPIISQFDILLEQGIITVDHLIKRSGAKVVERGPLFKIKPNSLGLLFPPSQSYDLIK